MHAAGSVNKLAMQMLWKQFGKWHWLRMKSSSSPLCSALILLDVWKRRKLKCVNFVSTEIVCFLPRPKTRRIYMLFWGFRNDWFRWCIAYGFRYTILNNFLFWHVHKNSFVFMFIFVKDVRAGCRFSLHYTMAYLYGTRGGITWIATHLTKLWDLLHHCLLFS